MKEEENNNSDSIVFHFGESLTLGNKKFSVRKYQQDSTLCQIYNEENSHPFCSHVHKKDRIENWFKDEKRATDLLCPECNISSSRDRMGGDDRTYPRSRYIDFAPQVHLENQFKVLITTNKFKDDPEQGIKTVPTAGIIMPGDNTGLYIVFQSGKIFRFDLIKKRLDRDNPPLLDISEIISGLPPLSKGMSQFADERGLLGLSFHPHYNKKDSPFFGEFYITYSAPSKDKRYDHILFLDRYKKEKGVTSKKTIMKIDQPQMNHDGGTILFGPATEDSRSGIGYMYFGVGDGGGFNDQHGNLLNPRDSESYLGNGQDLNTLLGKMLRIDVNVPFDKAPPYIIPAENPLDIARGTLFYPTFSMSRKLEIFAYGLRNPWKFSFDKLTGRLFIADVGQNKVEEINLIENTSIQRSEPLNFGWRALEGGVELTDKNIFNLTVLNEIGGYDRTVPPILEYHRDKSVAAVIGGYLYRGKQIPSLYGSYIFGDYLGKIFYATQEDKKTKKWQMHTLIDRGEELEFIHSFAVDTEGELYVLRMNPKSNTISMDKIVSSELSKNEIDHILDSVERVAAGANVLSALRRGNNGEKVSPKMHISIITLSGDTETRSMKDAWKGSIDISRGKAYTAMAFSSDQNAITTRSIGELSQTGPWSSTDPLKRPPLHNIGNSNPQHGIIEFPGGIPIYKSVTATGEKRLVGGLGVSGDVVDVDEEVAVKGLPIEYEPPASIRIDQTARVPYVKDMLLKNEQHPLYKTPLFSISNWRHLPAIEEYLKLLGKYGEPTGVTNFPGGMVIWLDVPLPFIEIVLKDESIRHGKPEHHCDYLYSSMRFYIPLDKIQAIYSISESIIYDQLAQKLTARCHFMAANTTTLYLVTGVVTGEITLEFAKNNYGESITAAAAVKRVYDGFLQQIIFFQKINRKQYPELPDLNCETGD